MSNGIMGISLEGAQTCDNCETPVGDKGLIVIDSEEMKSGEAILGMQEASTALVEVTDSLEVAQNSVKSLSAIKDAISEDQALSPIETQAINVAVEHFKRVNNINSLSLSLESIEDPSIRRVALEGVITETLSKIWAAIKEAIKKAIDWIKEFFNKLFGNSAKELIKNTKINLAKLKELAKKDKEIKINPVNFLPILFDSESKELTTASLKKGLICLLDLYTDMFNFLKGMKSQTLTIVKEIEEESKKDTPNEQQAEQIAKKYESVTFNLSFKPLPFGGFEVIENITNSDLKLSTLRIKQVMTAPASEPIKEGEDKDKGAITFKLTDAISILESVLQFAQDFEKSKQKVQEVVKDLNALQKAIEDLEKENKKRGERTKKDENGDPIFKHLDELNLIRVEVIKSHLDFLTVFMPSFLKYNFKMLKSVSEFFAT